MTSLHSSSADALLTAEQVAQMLGVTPAWVYAQSRCGRIPTVTLGRYRRYRRAAIETGCGASRNAACSQAAARRRRTKPVDARR